MMVLSKNMHSILAFLLLCGLVVGSLERGQSSHRRRTAVADRSSPASIPMGDDDDSDSGKGMRSEKGKGMKSLKSSGGLHDLSMSMELGKGMKMEKFTKKGKSDKASKKLKKEKHSAPGTFHSSCPKPFVVKIVMNNALTNTMGNHFIFCV